MLILVEKGFPIFVHVPESFFWLISQDIDIFIDRPNFYVFFLVYWNTGDASPQSLDWLFILGIPRNRDSMSLPLAFYDFDLFILLLFEDPLHVILIIFLYFLKLNLYLIKIKL